MTSRYVHWPAITIAAALLTFWPALAVGAAVGLVPPLLAILGLATLDYAAFTLQHEASHGLVARGRDAVNQWVGELAAAVLMCRFNGFRQVHLRHHLHVNENGRDPDRWSGEGPPALAPLRWATSDLHYWVEYDRRQPLSALASRASNLSLIVLITLVAVIIAAGHGWSLVLYWVLPARVALFVATWLFDWLPHQRPFGAPHRDDPLRATVNLAVPRWVDPLLLGHAHHLTHHLYPTIPFHHLRRRWLEERDTLLSRGAREVPLFSRPRPRPDAEPTCG